MTVWSFFCWLLYFLACRGLINLLKRLTLRIKKERLAPVIFKSHTVL